MKKINNAWPFYLLLGACQLGTPEVKYVANAEPCVLKVIELRSDDRNDNRRWALKLQGQTLFYEELDGKELKRKTCVLDIRQRQELESLIGSGKIYRIKTKWRNGKINSRHRSIKIKLRGVYFNCTETEGFTFTGKSVKRFKKLRDELMKFIETQENTVAGL